MAAKKPLSGGKAATVKVGLLRLERLVKILEDAHKRYKMLDPVSCAVYDEDGEITEGYKQSQFEHPCGTPACALGHYAFNTPQRWGWNKNNGIVAAPEFEEGAFAQAMHEFALVYPNIEELFDTLGCGNAKTAKEAAQYIRKFVARKRKALGLKKPKKA